MAPETRTCDPRRVKAGRNADKPLKGNEVSEKQGENAQMVPKCVPPERWRSHQWHMLEADRDENWHPPQVAYWRAPAGWMGDDLGWSNDFGLSFSSPEEAATEGWRYAGPILQAEKIERLRTVLLQASATLETLHPQAGGDRSFGNYVELWRAMLMEIDAALAETDDVHHTPTGAEP